MKSTNCTRLRLRVTLCVNFICAVWAGLLIAVGADPTSSLPELTSHDLQLTLPDLRQATVGLLVNSSDLSVTSADIIRDPIGLRRLLRARPDLRSSLERHQVSAARGSAPLPNAVEEKVHPEATGVQIEAILDSLAQPVEAEVTSELEELSTNLFFSPLFSSRDKSSITVGDTITNNAGEASPHIADSVGLDSEKPRKKSISKLHSAISTQAGVETSYFKERHTQPSRELGKGMRAGNVIQFHSGTPFRESEEKTTVGELIKPEIHVKSNIPEMTSSLASKSSGADIKFNTNESHIRHPVADEFVIRNYLVNGIRNSASLLKAGEDEITNSEAMKNTTSGDTDNSGLVNMEHSVKKPFPMKNHSTESVNGAAIHNGLSKDHIVQSNSLNAGKLVKSLAALKADEAPYPTADFVSLETPDSALRSSEKQAQTVDLGENPGSNDVESDRSSTQIDATFELASPSENPPLKPKNKKFHGGHTTGSNSVVSAGLGSRVDGNSRPVSQLRDPPGSRAKNIQGSGSRPLDKHETQEDAPELESQPLDASGSYAKDTEAGAGSEFPDILGRGGDLLEGIVVYTIDPFAGRRRGTRQRSQPGGRLATAPAAGGGRARSDRGPTARSRDTLFTCHDREPGYYPIRQTGCQVYYHCTGEGRRFQYRCGGGTAFNTNTLVCDHIYNVVCDKFATERP